MFETRQVHLMLFYLNKDQFCFLLMLKTSSAEVWKKIKKKCQGNENCSAPTTVIGLTKVANERYLPNLKLCGKACLCIFMYCMYESGKNLG